MPDLAIAALVEVVSIACVVHLWTRAPAGAMRKLVWTPIVLLPVLGPLFYGGFYSMPDVQSEDLRAAESNLED